MLGLTNNKVVGKVPEFNVSIGFFFAPCDNYLSLPLMITFVDNTFYKGKLSLRYDILCHT